MINLNSLQAGGMQPEADNYKQLAIDLQNKVQNQMYDVEEAVMEMLQTGEDPNSVGMALMTLGYKQEDVIKLFQSLQQQQQPAQEEVAQDEETSEVEQMVEDTAPMQQPMAKKGGSFKDWYKQLGGGTHNTYYAQFGTEKPRIGETQSQFSSRVYGNPGVYNNTDVWNGQEFVDPITGQATAIASTESLSEAFEKTKNQSNVNSANQGFPGTIDQTQFPGFTFGDTSEPEPIKDFTFGALNFDDSNTNANMPVMTNMTEIKPIRPSDLQIPVEPIQQETVEKVPEKEKQTPFTDAVNAISFVNRMFFPQFDPNRVYEQTMADNAFAAKNYQPALGHKDVHRGIQQSGLRVPFINFGQNGTEMNKFEDYFMMQYGGGNFPQMQQDNTATNMMSEQEAAALANYLSEIDKANQILSQTQGQIRIPDVNPYFSFLNNQNLPRGANDSMTVDLSQPRDTADGMNYMNVLYDYDAREQPKFFGRYNQYLNITPDMVRQGRFIPYKQMKNNKMQIGGMNPMSDFFMDNDIPLYQGGGGDIDLSAYPMDENGLYILNAIPDLPTMRAAAKYNQKVKGIVPSKFGPRVDTIRTQYQQTPPALRTPTIPLTPEEQRAREEYIIKLKEQHERVEERKKQGPAYKQRYGGDPFMPKRKLRKKTGGQIADIPTEILKKLMAKGAKFDIL